MFYQNFDGVVTNGDVLYLVLLFISAVGVVCGFFYILKKQLSEKEND